MYHLGLKKGEKNEKRVIKGSKLNDRLTGNLEGLNTSGSFCKVGSWCIDLASMLMFHPFLILNPISVIISWIIFPFNLYKLHRHATMHRKFMYRNLQSHSPRVLLWATTVPRMPSSTLLLQSVCKCEDPILFRQIKIKV